MIIPPNENGWSYDDSTGNWKLVYSDNVIIFYEETNVSIATQSTLFVGTQEECEAEIVRVGLKHPPEIEATEFLDDNTLLETETEVSGGGGGVISNVINSFDGLFGG